MRSAIFAIVLLIGSAIPATTPAAAQECAINPDAIGTSRVIEVNPLKLRRIGSLQYPTTLPLNDHEIVLTFDDGPIPPQSLDVLDTLASECVKATFFILGQTAEESPDLVRRVASDGHSVGTHTQTHARLSDLSLSAAKKEIEMGISSVVKALAGTSDLAPFFRAPFLETTAPLEGYLVSRGLMLWGIDFQADDWLDISPDEVINRAMNRIEQRGKGVLLLHDMQARTAEALGKLLAELKTRGYKIVHVVPQPTSPTPERGAQARRR